MKRFVLFSIICSFSLIACKEKPQSILSAKEIVNKSIEISGGEKFDASIIEFDFRDKHYKAIRNKGVFQLERHFKDSIFNIIDIVDNDGFNRFVDEEKLEVPDSMAVKYTASVNSVHYFSVLPYGLNDASVIKTILGEETIKNKIYYKVQVTFKQEGGGEDFEDVFMYWINSNTFKTDYLAYSYNENDGLGFRFREANNERMVNGIRFVDYNNYKPKENTISVSDLGNLFETNQLELLSKIELKNVIVN